jgi:hypothetical protein
MVCSSGIMPSPPATTTAEQVLGTTKSGQQK